MPVEFLKCKFLKSLSWSRVSELLVWRLYSVLGVLISFRSGFSETRRTYFRKEANKSKKSPEKPAIEIDGSDYCTDYTDLNFNNLSMISQKDLSVNYFLLRICTLIGYIPTDFNRKTGKARPLKSYWRRGLARVWFVIGALYAFYTNIRLGQSLLWREFYVRDHLAFHIQIATFSLVGTFWSYRLFMYNPQVDIALFNQLYPAAGEIRPGSRIPRRSEYTIQEWMILVLPFSLFLYCTNIFAWMYIYDRKSIQFLFSIVPTTYRSEQLFRVFLVFECLILDYYLAVAFQSIFLQISFFQNGSENFTRRMAFIKSKDFMVNSTSLLKECMNCRKMQLNIKLFNDLNAHIIFACKIYWLSVAIDNYFFGITFFHRKPIASACLLGLGIYHTFLFSIMYDKAFSVPERMKEFKNEILVTSMQLRNSLIQKEIRRIITSIPLVGIKVGSFHRLERESTPNYVDYITEKVSGLLITFG